ncbi:HAMP domain-containing sensor histidine kinase [Bacillus spongiae]|uniref:histidine kinase n=1 Tax=Bacillus spongiae TaxID=2683610 RepID=A0ABU8HIJ0_9BACI
MSLKRKYLIILILVIISVPVSVLFMNLVALGFYKLIFTQNVPFHESFAYTIMYGLFILSFMILAYFFSRSINSLLKKITILNNTIRDLAKSEEIPEKIEIHSKDEVGDLIKSVNLLIERTTYKEIELKNQEGIQKEFLTKLRHDINTPLTAIRLQLFYLENKYPDIPYESLYQKIQYISDLTNEFHLKSVQFLDDSYISKDDISIEELLNKMVKKWGYLFSINNIELRFKVNEKDFIWKSHGLWLQRLFDNIFQNVLKHSQADMFEIVTHNEVITMKDNGSGFTPGESSDGIGLKVIDDLASILELNYTLQSGDEGTVFHFSMKK